MFENLELLTLQQYWYFLVSLLGALLVFLMFVQGGQTMIYQLGKTETERKMIVNSLGRKWELTFSTLVLFGGAFFASFPLFYSTSFGGAYWVWMIILFAFIIQAVSYEYRTKVDNFLGKRTYENFLFANGLIAPIFIGTAVATFFTGSPFSVDLSRLVDLTSVGMPIISQWETPFYGLEAIWTVENLAFVTNLSLGLGVFFLSRVTASLYFINNIDDDNIYNRSLNALKKDTVIFLVFFLLFVFRLLTIDGFAVDPNTSLVSMESFKYLNNFLAMPLVLVFFFIGVVSVLAGIFVTLFKGSKKGIWITGFGVVLTVLGLLFVAGYNNTAFYPSTFDLQSSLTIMNSSSSHYTLAAMSYVSLMIPLVLGYIWFVWKKMDAKQITKEEVENDSHMY